MSGYLENAINQIRAATAELAESGNEGGNEMSKDTGGPAFPFNGHIGQIGENDGMTLRDYFAAKAMQSFLLAPNPNLTDADGVVTEVHIASSAYMMADAMLKARAK